MHFQRPKVLLPGCWKPVASLMYFAAVLDPDQFLLPLSPPFPLFPHTRPSQLSKQESLGTSSLWIDLLTAGTLLKSQQLFKSSAI